ncbi:hypothetical protein ACIQUB_07905 [Rhizobium sp. NPDC090275]|uniref:hypothetical protein n=1 Tax=Rhizobium sp. NPDC090275 TaxID=3364498 RepID=UPI003839FDC5
MSEDHAKSLKAINPVSRIAFTRALYQQVGRWIERCERVYFVTLISREHSFSLENAADFDVTILKEWIREIIGARDFVGFIEPAYFYRSPFLEDGQRPHVSWHSHLLVWNVPPSEMSAKAAATNSAYETFVPGAKPFHYYTVDNPTALQKLLYMSKDTLSEYAASPPAPDKIDETTGEIIVESNGKWRTQKREIRPLALARVTTVIGGRSLKNLTIASGEGKQLRTRALLEARRKLRRSRKIAQRTLEKLLLASDPQTR